MTMPFSLPEGFKLVQLAAPQTTNTAVVTDTVSLKTAHKAWFVFEFTQAVSDLTTIVFRQTTDVAGATGATIAASRVWQNGNTASSDTLVAGTSGTGVTLGSGALNQQVVAEFDPALFTEGYDCINGTVAASSQATNFVSVTGYIATRFPQATPPTVITD